LVFLAFVSFVVKAVSRRGAKGRYQNPCRYQRRYQLSAHSKALRRKGSEVATLDRVFGESYLVRPDSGFIYDGWRRISLICDKDLSMFQALAEMRRCNHSFLSIELCFVSFLSDCVTEISLRQPQAAQNRYPQ